MPTLSIRVALVVMLALTLVASAEAHAGVAPVAHAAARCAGEDARPTARTVDEVRRAVRCLLDRERRARGLGSLRANVQLQVAAHRHSLDMARRDYFAHTSLGGASLTDRIRRAGYLRRGAWTVGENIAWGAGTRASARSVMRAWMASPGHRANILSPRYREVGIGIALGVPARGAGAGATYTTDFGRRS